nr:hypothetical protein [uncultured Sphingomonas sp.]
MDSEKIWRLWRAKGMKAALITIGTAVLFGTVDSFTSRVIPSIVQYADDSISPPGFLLHFKTPVTVSAIKVSKVGAAVPLQTGSITPVRAAIRGTPGNYDLSLERDFLGGKQVLNTVITVPARDAIIPIDTAEDQWTTVAAIESLDGTKTPLMALVRLAAAPADWDLVKTLPADLPRDIVTAALHEVGVSEIKDSDRVARYWEATEMGARGNVSPDLPWNGTFVAYAVSTASITPPPGSPAARSWRAWGRPQSYDDAAPGSVALFNPHPERWMVGIILRKRPQCIDTILGNIRNQVVISCISTRPAAIRAPI